MISKTQVGKRARKKTNSELVETILLAKKHNLEIAGALAGPTRKMPALNLGEIGKRAKENETVIVPGKVLGQGNIDKKIKVVAFKFSKNAEEKLKKAKCPLSTIKEELGKNKKIEGRILKQNVKKNDLQRSWCRYG